MIKKILFTLMLCLQQSMIYSIDRQELEQAKQSFEVNVKAIAGIATAKLTPLHYCYLLQQKGLSAQEYNELIAALRLAIARELIA